MQESQAEDIRQRLDLLDKAHEDISQQLEELKRQQAQEQEASQERLKAEEERSAKDVAERGRLEGAQVAEIQSRLDSLEKAREDLGKEIAALGEAGQEAEEQRKEQGADLQEVQQRLGGMADAQGELRVAVDKADKDLEKTSSGLEEQMGALVQSTAELMGKVEELAPAEALKKLSARVDGGFSALLVRLETDKWMRENVDKVADNVSNSFLRLLDDSSQKLSGRMERCEQRLSELGS
uniref:Uncharacterized protein n=1 Tax=Alexandrium catenella TaxID=2925 RepID=A0A7S1LT24_ALECA